MICISDVYVETGHVVSTTIAVAVNKMSSCKVKRQKETTKFFLDYRDQRYRNNYYSNYTLDWVLIATSAAVNSA